MKRLLLTAGILILLPGFVMCFSIPPDIADIEGIADIVVEGRVTGIESMQDSPRGLIYTDAEITVSEYLKGSGDEIIRVRFVGGEVDRTGLLVSNMPRFRRGERVFLYLRDAATMPGDLEGIFEVVGSADGKISLAGGFGEDVSALHSGYNFIQAHNGRFLNWHPADLPIDITVSTWRMTDRRWVDAVFAALGAWEGVPTSSVTFDYRGTVEGMMPGAKDGVTKIGWNAYAWIGEGVGVNPGAAAVTMIWYNLDHQDRITDRSYIKEVEIVFNSYLQWTVTGEFNKYDVQGIATHELGHLLGLAHTAAFVAQQGTLTTMIDGNDFWNILGYGIEDTYLLRELHDIDRQGLSILYPPGYPGSELPRGPSGGCFIASAAFGSSLAAEVSVLSEYRDSALRGRFAGDLFVSGYERAGPFFARALLNNSAARGIMRLHLRPLIRIINGVN